MKRILILVALSLFLCSTGSAFQGGGGESTKKGSSKKAVTKKNSEIESKRPQPTRRPAPPAQFVLVLGPALSINLGNNVKLELVRINAGSFEMGSDKYEKPVHRVNITKPFYLGKYEVTQAQWEAVMGSNPSYFKGCGANCPVELSWDDAQSFINKLNENNLGFKYRLPTEAEWEYACRAGTTGDYAGDLDSMAWYGNNSGNSRLDADAIWREDLSNYHMRVTDNGNKMHSVGTKQPNAWGLYDMHGNVWELVQDFIEEYKAGPAVDPSGPATGQQRVLRGGSWYDPATQLGCASRISSYAPRARGIRVVAVVRTP